MRILHLEDEPDFAELVSTMLAQDAVDANILRVGDKADYEQALGAEKFDLILSDYHLPTFNGLEALAIARKVSPETPFILISGTIGETAAVDSLKAGATDYLLKQKPERLAAAVRRAVEEASERARLRETEAEMRRREKYFRTLTENSLDVLSIVNREGIFTYVSPSVENTLGWKPAELVGRNSFSLVHPDDLARVTEAFQNLMDQPDQTARIECRQQHKNGSWLRLELFARNRFDDPDIGGIVAYTRDVTDRWRAEMELRYSENQYRLLFQENPNPMWVFDLETMAILEVNEAAVQHYGYSRDEFLTLTIAKLRAPDKNGHGRLPGSPATLHTHNTRGHIWRHQRKRGDVIEVDMIWSPMAFQGRFSALAMATDVTERLRSEHRNSVFLDLSHRLGTATTAAEAAQFIGDAAKALFEWDNFSLDLYSPDRNEMVCLSRVTAEDGPRAAPRTGAEAKHFEELARRIISGGPELISESGLNPGFSSGMIAPMRRGARVIGVLFAQSRRAGAYTRRDLESLEMLANESGGALERVRVEDALHESQRRFRDLFENSPDAIFVEDLDGNVLDVN
ncbi:MAG: PAS domain S-box protein, partial [Limisphaerales bacterium]